ASLMPTDPAAQPHARTRRKTKVDLTQPEEGRRVVAHERSLPYGPNLRVNCHRLDNGLRVLLLMDRSAPVVSYHTWFRVGSRHEADGKTGLAHLLEHLMFGEFDDLQAGEYDRLMEEAGAEINAATWVDWTYYYANAPSSQLDRVISLESRRMGMLRLREESFASELEVVSNERRMRVEDDIGGAVAERLFELAFEKHAYRRPTIGWLEDIAGLTREDCQDFYRTFYAPNNATIVIAGRFDEQRTLQKLAEAYAYLEPAELPVEQVTPEPPQLEVRRDVMRKATSTQKLSLAYHGPALGDVDHAPLALLSDILFGGRASRAHQSMVQRQEVASDVRGWIGPFHHPGLIELQATARQGHTTGELLDALDAELERVREAPVAEAELERAKARAELGLVRSMETSAGRAEQIAFYDVVVGNPAGAFDRLDKLRATTRSDILRVARRYLDPDRRSIIEVLPLPSSAASTAASSEGDA
ncbi:MAG: M16 family metallopeptidase, partial [Myxococcota bacterium]